MGKRLWVKEILFCFSLVFTFLLSAEIVLAQTNCNQCHSNIAEELKDSVHSPLSCITCHSDVEGYPHDPGIAVTKKESVDMCSKCHKGIVTESYQESFHGKAIFLGSQRSASCVDCHSSHKVLGQDNPHSQVAKENIPETCAKCHKNPSPGFAEGAEHFQLSAMGPGKPMYYTAKFFVWLTIIVMTLLVIHIELQCYHSIREMLRERKGR
ncbi:MAG: molecular chaperone DnaJ [Desulfitobacterium sp.]|nr:molecular chaperone DnaJ [Desulfitobacterium sp.]